MVNVMLGVFYHNKNIGRNTGVGKSRFTVVSIQNTGFFKRIYLFSEKGREGGREASMCSCLVLFSIQTTVNLLLPMPVGVCLCLGACVCE